jgi:uncharacterized protein YbjT (DUF2867 family)
MEDVMVSNRDETPVVLVTGATGNQGGAVVDALSRSARRWRIRALTRNPQGPAAQALRARGVEVVGGDLAQPGTLAAPLAGAHGVFSVQNYRSAGAEGEVLQGTSLVDAAVAAGVQMFVHSSIGGAERARGIPLFDAKWAVEQHLRASGLMAAVLRPATFANVFTMRGAAIGLSLMAAALGPDKPLQMIAIRDIGEFARLAFERPEDFAGSALEIAGDELTVPEIARTLRECGRPVGYRRVPKALLKLMGKEGRLMLWLGEAGYRADLPALRQTHPGLLTLRAALTAGTEVTA